MRERRAIGALLLLSALIALGTCQLQFNKSNGNNVALKVVVPGGMSGGGKGLSGSKSLAGGTSLTVKITPPSGPQQTISAPVGGKSSVDFSVNLSSSGTYQVSVQMLDVTGNITLSAASTQLTVPTGNYPVVLKMPSNLLNAVLTDSTGFNYLAASFSPTTYTYSPITLQCSPYGLTVTTVDPSATVSVIETDLQSAPVTLLPAGSPSGSACTLNNPFVGGYNTVTIVVTASDGTTVETYTLMVNPNGCG